MKNREQGYCAVFIFLSIMMCLTYRVKAYQAEKLLDRSVFSALNENERPAFMTQKVSLNAKEKSLKRILKIIEEQVPVTFTYQENVLEETTKYSFNLQDVSLKKALHIVLEQPKVEFFPVKGGYIVLKKKTKEQQAVQSAITGTVSDSETGETLPGANVSIAGTTEGTSADENGQFIIEGIEPGTYTLVATFIGYQENRREVTISEGQETLTVDFVLQPSAKALEEMVVTAFSIQREQRSLGTSVGKVSGDELAESDNLNVANSLSGRVSGVKVTGASSGPAGASKIVIRGNSSLGGNNQPLYVVDGVPIDNTNRASAGRWGGYDRGGGISNINPNDIADVSILKGPNAAALYGQRGANGVILITTKSGENRDGIGVEFSSSATFGEPWVLPDFQNKYGLGTQGQHRFYNDGNGNIISRSTWVNMGQPDGYIPQMTTINDGIESPVSWGPEMNGEQIYTWDGVSGTYSPQPDNVSDFYNTQKTLENSLSLSGGNENTTFRLSYRNLQTNGLQLNNEINKHNISLSGSHQFNERFSANAKVNVVSQDVQGRPGLSDQQRNVAYVTRYMPRNIVESSLHQYQLTEDDVNNPNGFHGYSPSQLAPDYTRHWSNATFTEQPYWSVNNTTADDSRQRLIGNISLQYELTDWASLSAKAGVDTYTDQYFSYSAIGTRVNVDGNIGESVHRFREINLEALASAEKDISEDISVSANIGGNYLRNYYRMVGQGGNRFSVPDLITIGNTEVQNTSFDLSEYEIQSLFAFGQFSFRDYLYLEWTARNDWSSTLPVDNDSFFYPSVNTNFVWSDAFELNSDILTYGSVRASWAQAGNSGDPYQLTGTYALADLTQAGQPWASFTNTIPLEDLENELTTSIEFGADLRFFEDRLSTEITYYNAVTENQILNIAIPVTSGFTNKTVNAGEIKNQGVELLISGTPVQTSDFNWDLTFNFGANRNKVVDLIEGVDRYQLGRDRNAIVFADPGQPFGEIYSATGRWLRDEGGNRMIDPSTGLPIKEFGQFAVGNAAPDWTGGINNTLNYKGLRINALVDISQGGEIFSQSNVVESVHGTTKRTIEGRDGTYVAKGVMAQPDGNGGWVSTGEQNTMEITAQEYWGHVVPSNPNAITEEFINDASYIALRELSIGYSFPNLVKKIQLLNSLRLSVVGRNLYYFERHTDGFSPESASFNVSNNSLGLEYASFPMARTVGFNVSVGL